jgi:HD-GYP domain-containing protein (c-di-GMP phosphodiesterase class II)
VKVAGLSLLMGKLLGYDRVELASLGAAALLKDVGYIRLPPGVADGPQGPEEGELSQVREHPSQGAEILGQSEDLGPEVIQAVLQHHERWDGGGYPNGLVGPEISSFARIVSIADSYYDLVSVRPWRPALMPHEAIEYVMAYSGEMFDPELVRLFARQVPLYPTGIMVELNTGEVAFVTDANVGHIGRPMVRICYDRNEAEEKNPYDVDLSDPRHQGQLIVRVLEY